MVEPDMRGQHGAEGKPDADDPGPALETPSAPLEAARLAFTSRLASFGLGEATERLLEAGGIIPPGRRTRRNLPIRDDLQPG